MVGDATGEGKFEDASHEASGAATPMSAMEGGGPAGAAGKKRKGPQGGPGGMSKKAKTMKKRLQVVDGDV